MGKGLHVLIFTKTQRVSLHSRKYLLITFKVPILTAPLAATLHGRIHSKLAAVVGYARACRVNPLIALASVGCKAPW